MDFDFGFPYASQRMPVMARNVVATSQPLAAQAGLEMLRRGGNAVDAAVAAAMALTVVEPTSNGIGGDAFGILWDGERLVGLNASGRSPAALTPERFAGRDAVPYGGWDSVTVPGAPSAWAALAERYASLPLTDLAGPAIRYAREGFLVSPYTAQAWALAPRSFGGQPGFDEAFLPDGAAPAAGSLWRFPEQGDTLEAIAESGAEAFYRGALAERIAAWAAETGGLLSADDLAAHEPDWVDPIGVDWEAPGGTLRLHEIPPNGQGLAALLALGILRHTEIGDLELDSAPWLHLQIEAMKLAFADAHRRVADPDHLDVPVAALLDDAYLRERAARIDRGAAGLPGHGEPRRSGTVYLATADADGRMVSYIQSNYFGFGSGVVVPGTGIALQNRGAGFVLEPGHPNRVGGGKRPFHTIIPGFVTRGGRPAMSFGVMGGPMQPQGHLQMVLRVFGHGQNPQTASDAPRWRVHEGRRVAIERGFAPGTLDALQELGHELELFTPGDSFGFGGAQLIARVDGGYVAGSDSRRDGHAVGF